MNDGWLHLDIPITDMYECDDCEWATVWDYCRLFDEGLTHGRCETCTEMVQQALEWLALDEMGNSSDE